MTIETWFKTILVNERVKFISFNISSQTIDEISKF